MALKPRGTWNMPNGAPPPREPMLNLPTSIMVLGGIMIAIQALQSFVLDSAQRQEFLLAFSFLPMRFNAVTAGIAFPGGVLGDIWTFVTYAFLHGSWMHLILNLVWMAAFATVLQRRIGTRNFLIFFVVTAAAGAAVHLFLHADSGSPLVGVSAVLSGAMAASARFAFSGGGFAGIHGTYRARCLTLSELRHNRQAVMFLSIWLILNLVFGLTAFMGGGASIAWEAHLGGFVAGLLIFPYLDPFTRPPRKPKPPKEDPPKKKPDHLRIIK